MSLPPALHQKYLRRFDELIAKGQDILANAEVRTIDDDPYGDWAAAGCTSPPRTITEIRHASFQQWQMNWVTLLNQIVPQTHPQRSDITDLASYAPDAGTLQKMLAILRAVKEDYENGFLADLPTLIRAEVAADYLAQAETLYSEQYHVAAAVLAGGVLEDTLRKMCCARNIAIHKPGGERRSVNTMNDDLARANAYNPAKADEIRAWAKNRNDCAHGDGDKVEPEDVGRMIAGIRAFVADQMR
jgi:hypothetical protein